MISAEVKVGEVPLVDVNWQGQQKSFDIVQGETKFLVSRFNSNPTGQIWDIEGGDGRLSYHLAIFCLGDKPEEWIVKPVGTTLPLRSTIDLIETVIADAQQKNAAHFLSNTSDKIIHFPTRT